MKNIRDKILDSREKRASIIKSRLASGDSVVSLRANIPGENKNIIEAYILINLFYPLLITNSDKQEFFESSDGPFYLFTFKNTSGFFLKERTKYLEESHELGRYVDIDVYQYNYDISREVKRKCILCDDLAVNCIVSRRHTVEELLNNIKVNVEEYLRNSIRRIIKDSVYLELDLDPKFGMVTPNTNGSHEDMDYNIMVKAIDAIIPALMDMYEFSKGCKNINELFPGIRKIGLKAEKRMFAATKGINAYKGLIFTVGLVLSAFSYKINNPNVDNDIFEIVKQMTRDILNDFSTETDSFGYKAFRKFGITGARGEAKNGYPHVKKAMEYLYDYSEECRYETLAYLISSIEDTNLLKRSGSYAKYEYNRSLFKDLIRYKSEKMLELNEYASSNNLSFGGSADLLVLTIFIKKLNELYKL